ncbi:MAG TPA: peptidase domain-containing ABC transporter [Azospirillaceae bacterium]|nr:peptidase domain-containing ABC transporter [Azospirillaceae bacterium]
MFGFSTRPGVPVVLQSEAAECGLACLAMVAGHHGHETDLGTLRRRFAISLKGVTLRQLTELAGKMELSSRAVRVELAALRALRTPAILHWDLNHFVVLKAVRGRHVVIHDPAAGVRRLTLEQASAHFTGVALELWPTAAFEKRSERAKLSIASLWGQVPGIKRALTQALVLSALLQVFAMLAPFHMQLAVDKAVLQEDGSLLSALALGFGLLMVFQVAVGALRSLILTNVAATLGFQMSANLFHHLIRLPLAWFERRHVGDVLSRFGAVRPIQILIAEGLVAAVVDGAMAVLTLLMILLYSPTLAVVVLVAFGLSGTIRITLFPTLRRRQEEEIRAVAQEQSTFIETVRAVQSLKLFGREADREGVWHSRMAEVIRRNVGVLRLRTGSEALNSLVSGLETVLVVYLGSRTVIAGDMSIGMLYAFFSYRQLFLDKAGNLLAKAVEWRMLDLHLDRLADIALEPREVDASASGVIEHTIAGGIELADISFRYGQGERPVLEGLHLTVRPGEFVAITGPSGCGKTTLMKVMLGLLIPEQGEIRLDGTPLSHVGTGAFRSQIGVVMQDDQLLSGTLAENICFFDPRPDLGWMRECARVAGIEGDILAMPMNYGTLVGDMGSTLSGGQRQRVLLARALYRRPRILFMDEGTSHLDVAKEREINAALSTLDITRIVIAHRPDTIGAAHRIIRLERGRVVGDTASRPVEAVAD